MSVSRLASDRYVHLLHVEGEALLAAAEGRLDRPVPACDDWTVRDVVEHVGTVYAHKVAALRHGRHPEPGEWQGPPAGEDPITWCHALLHQIAGALAHRAADEPAWTWCEAEQTVGFWQRRMALESAVHRFDVEAAGGEPTPVAADLAVDGIDEVLRVMLEDADFTDASGPQVAAGSVSARIGAVTVAGVPSEVLLWLWGRRGDETVTIDGTPTAVLEVHRLLREATQ
jgi:uncharacterized protein (TIGR03083 family)